MAGIKHCKECQRVWTWNGDVSTCFQCVQNKKMKEGIAELVDALDSSLEHCKNLHTSLDFDSENCFNCERIEAITDKYRQ